MDRPPIVFIDRYYDDEPDAEQPWPRRRLRRHGRSEWGASCDFGTHADEAWFDDADEAIAWADERAELVLIRLGSSEQTVYSAGRVNARERLDGSGRAFPVWPPAGWPHYLGPPGD